MVFFTLVLFWTQAYYIISAEPIMRSVSKLQYCMWPSVAEPVPSICSVWANAYTRTPLSFTIENKAIRALPLQNQHTALSACTPKMGLQLIWGPLKSGACCEDSQPASWSQRNVSFFFSPDCFCFWPRIALSFLLRAAEGNTSPCCYRRGLGEEGETVSVWRR